jgi:hypothetical protein
LKVITGHQPAYLPWLGLIHKASLADIFIYMDDVQYLEQDWNNRNQIKTGNNQSSWLTVPVDLKNSSSRILKDILIKDEGLPFEKSWRAKHWNALQMSYGKAPYFKEYRPLFEGLYCDVSWKFLSELNLKILTQLFEIFQVKAKVVVASELNFLEKKSDLILEHATHFEADIVVTGMHGKDYIQTEDFKKKGVKVVFQDYQHPVYPQRFEGFVPRLTCLDLLFNCGPESVEICFSNNITRNDL